MPTYEYVCKNCGHALEELQSMNDDPLTRCPQCHRDTLARIMGGGGGLIFKGSGFYLTDYRKGGASASADEQKGKAKEKEKDKGINTEAGKGEKSEGKKDEPKPSPPAGTDKKE